MIILCRILDLQNQLNDAIKRNGKFHEQLVQTEQQVEAKWIDHVKEKDKRFNTCIRMSYVCMHVRIH